MFDKTAYQKDYMAKQREKSKMLEDLYSIFDNHASKWIHDLESTERETLNKIEAMLNG